MHVREKTASYKYKQLHYLNNNHVILPTLDETPISSIMDTLSISSVASNASLLTIKIESPVDGRSAVKFSPMHSCLVHTTITGSWPELEPMLPTDRKMLLDRENPHIFICSRGRSTRPGRKSIQSPPSKKEISSSYCGMTFIIMIWTFIACLKGKWTELRWKVPDAVELSIVAWMGCEGLRWTCSTETAYVGC